jgi:hypothetical protein
LTLREAIIATYELGYRYIWIDSLCIKQDSMDDWEGEAAKMASYYSAAVCNLAAGRGDDCHAGLFSKRNAFASHACIVTERWTNTSPQFSYHVHDSFEQFVRTTKQSSLAKRGWIRQELTLAPRTIYFGEEEIYFECLAFRAAESRPTKLLAPHIRNKLGRTMELLPTGSTSRRAQARILNWAEIVTSYSSCQLSFPLKDKLTAIGGLAQTYGPPKHYLAGIWRPQLELWLLWRPMGAKRYEDYVAPSWSWASINGYVMFDGDIVKKFRVLGYADDDDGYGGSMARDSEPFFYILDAQVTLHGTNPYGRVSDGFLRLTGGPFHLSSIPTSMEMSKVTSGSEITMKLYPDDMEPYILSKEKLDFVCFPITSTHLHELGGLILLPTGRGAGEYTRGGVFMLESDDEEQTIGFQDIFEHFGAQIRGLDIVEYESRTGRVLCGIDECTVVIK